MLYKTLQVAFLMTCMISLTSWADPPLLSIPNKTPIDTYTDYQFYRDAYNFRIVNKLEIPQYYYGKLNIPAPKPIVVAPPEPSWDSPIPEWVLTGILKTESRSYYDSKYNIVYVDKRVGTSGERGPFQITPIAFNQIKKKGEIHSRVMKDMAFAQEMTERYLLYLYNGPAKQNWNTTIRMYNGGPSNYGVRATLRYLASVKKHGIKN